MTKCPKCASTDVRPSRCKSAWESWRKHWLTVTPRRCGRCGWRGWVPDLLPPVDVRAHGPQHRVCGDAQSPIGETSLAAAPPRWDELDFHVLNIPRGQIHTRQSN